MHKTLLRFFSRGNVLWFKSFTLPDKSGPENSFANTCRSQKYSLTLHNVSLGKRRRRINTRYNLIEKYLPGLQNISLHIEFLLRTHDCVIFPGIGAFLRTHRDASYCKESGELTAPATRICFNSSIVTSDGLLCHSVARRCKVSFEEAAVMVSEASENCRNALDMEGEYSLGHLGILRPNEERNISFRPYAPRFSHIWSAISPVSESQDKKEASEIKTESASAASKENYYTFRVPRRVVRYAAMAAVCLFTAATLLLPSANRPGTPMSAPRQYASVVPGVEKIAEKLNNTDNNTPAQVSEPETETADMSVQQEDSARFYLIVATFTKEADCEEFISQQPDSSDLRIVSNGKVSRVYSAASRDRDKLMSVMRSDGHKVKHPQAWIWENPDTELIQ